ncbi:hypothetical protein BC830DRAFT_1158220 [Chytriomyces sp. MP71]|nr:hypothetical protein BC830DRAFT_1158220 [Chytriomyces sp. MP71]
MASVDVYGLPVTCMILGVCLEASYTSLFHTVPILIDYRQCGKKNPVVMLIVLFNSVAIVFVVFEVWSQFGAQETCVPVNFAANLFFHLFYLLFDVFMLYKSYVVTQFNKFFCVFAILSALYRFGWAFGDLYLSQGQWIPASTVNATGVCVFNQNPVTGFNSTVADMVADCLATIPAAIAVFRMGSIASTFSEMTMHLFKENVVRTVLIVILNSFVMYAFATWTNGFFLFILLSIQILVYIKLLNLELYWIGGRKDILRNSVTTGPTDPERGPTRCDGSSPVSKGWSTFSGKAKLFSKKDSLK